VFKSDLEVSRRVLFFILDGVIKKGASFVFLLVGFHEGIVFDRNLLVVIHRIEKKITKIIYYHRQFFMLRI
jgi:hypothetical protein